MTVKHIDFQKEEKDKPLTADQLLMFATQLNKSSQKNMKVQVSSLLAFHCPEMNSSNIKQDGAEIKEFKPEKKSEV